jgi:hypothetical protein
MCVEGYYFATQVAIVIYEMEDILLKTDSLLALKVEQQELLVHTSVNINEHLPGLVGHGSSAAKLRLSSAKCG